MNFSTVVCINKIVSKLCLKCKTWGDDWGVSSPSYVPDPSARDYYPHSRIAWNLHFCELSSFPIPDHTPGTTWRSVTKYLAICFLIVSTVLPCCNLLPVDVSSELMKICSVYFKVIKISGFVALALAFDIRVLVQNIRNHDVTVQTFNIWPLWHLQG